MKFTELRVIAKNTGVKTVKSNKRDIIRQIQIKEGNIPCFDTGLYDCKQFNCMWREDCIK